MGIFVSIFGIGSLQWLWMLLKNEQNLSLHGSIQLFLFSWSNLHNNIILQ
jgi:hypothetical protein